MLRCLYRTSIFFSVVKSMSLQLAMNVTIMGGTNKYIQDFDRENYFTWLAGILRLCRIGGCFDICQKFERIPSFCITHGSLKRRYLSFILDNVTPQITMTFKLTKWGPEISHVCLCLPRRDRGPSPNGIYVYFGRLCLFSSVKWSGSNLSGSGKYIGS